VRPCTAFMAIRQPSCLEVPAASGGSSGASAAVLGAVLGAVRPVPGISGISAGAGLVPARHPVIPRSTPR
jgi:hypothetical protein